jgi:hypothetical protein
LRAREAYRIGRLKLQKNEARFFHKRDELKGSIAKTFLHAMRAAAVEIRALANPLVSQPFAP